MTKRAVIYSRISRDTEGVGAGVERQRQDCVKLCEQRGWRVTDTVTDNDFSAFSGKRRPGYARLLELVEADLVDVLVAWHPDRLHRSPRELEHFVDVLDRHRVEVATVTAGDLDLGTPDGRLRARITGAVARKESEDKSRRLRRKHQELAEQGRVSGGGNRPFGFEADRVKHNRDEVKLIREAAKRVLAGESLYAIANDWNARDVPTVTGARWTTTHLRTLLLSPRVAGLRSHHGATFDATWKPILNRDTWEQVGRVLRGRSRAKSRPARSYLLSGGLIQCGRCGAALVSAPRPYGRAYACLSSHGGCNGVTIKADPVEELVAEAMIEAVDTPLLAKAHRQTAAEDGGAEDELQEVDARLRTLAEMFAAGEIGRAEWTAARSVLDERRIAAEARLTLDPNPLAGYRSAGALRKAWPSLTVDQQRAILAAVFDAVTIAPAGRAGGRVDLGRVDLRWKA